MLCPKCHSTLVSHLADPSQIWVWGLKWKNLYVAIRIGREMYSKRCYVLSKVHHLKEPRKKFFRLRYFCRCRLCNFKWDIITAGDLNELS